MFEKATRMKLRFAYKGPCSVEDLWELSVEELDGIYQKLSKTQKESNSDSLLKVNAEDRVLNLRIGIVKHIVAVKLQEDETRKMAAENKLKKQKYAEIIADKEDAGLKGLPIEELKAKMAELG